MPPDHLEPPPVLDYEPPSPERREWLRRRRWKIVATMAVIASFPALLFGSSLVRHLFPEFRRIGWVLLVLSSLAAVAFTIAVRALAPKRR